jgi:hypothetical protein
MCVTPNYEEIFFLENINPDSVSHFIFIGYSRRSNYGSILYCSLECRSTGRVMSDHARCGGGRPPMCTDKKENRIFLIYEETQK